MSNLPIWLTPIWLIATGVTVGALILLLVWLVLRAVNRPAGRAVSQALGEGVLLPLSYFVAGLALLAVLATPTMPWKEAIESLKRLPSVSTVEKTITVEEGSEQELPLVFKSSELQSYSFDSEQEIVVNLEAGKGYADPLLTVEAQTPYKWSPGGMRSREFEGDIEKIFLVNESDQPTQVTMQFERDVEMPEVRVILYSALAIMGLVTVYFLIRWLAPQVSVIASATSKETINQPIFLLLLVGAATLLFVYVWIPYNTFGEDVKMVKTTGMTTIKVFAILMALWTASVTIADEIEGRTALTVLSKPVGRRQFVIGKFLGIAWPIALMFLILGIFFVGLVSFKVVYDARESSKAVPIWQDCYREVIQILPGLLLAFYEAVIMAAISVAVSTRLPMIPNLVICGSIYVLGHLAALIVNSSVGDIVYVRFIGQLLAVILPVLDHFEIEGAIAGSSTAPGIYLLYAAGYSLLYCVVAMLLALILFEDRDLA
ncbi:ABC transporter permease subunit [Adhaeretor mobilis]|uniref:ABC-2 family transporter protein n=1 Tax=Adhaeretor mobilis TaxID=1930276 RepID=A0A517MU81_9BACT|nr:ABC transporter permease subunit [Adhaeretor mobilis]QDS98444.1 ABC-2 family transporter protein [Adhaeretor mobilis]